MHREKDAGFGSLKERMEKVKREAIRSMPKSGFLVSDLPALYQSKRFPEVEINFGRINVVLGSNGAGKSSLLTEIRDNIRLSGIMGKPVYIEGGRAIEIKDNLDVDPKEYQKYHKFDSANKTYQNKRGGKLSLRLRDALIVLDKLDNEIRYEHSDRTLKWFESNPAQIGSFPARPKPPLTRLFEMFQEIFPDIGLSYDNAKRVLRAEKNGALYGPSRLSDGEKQVFSILAEFIEMPDEYNVVIVDEPELNLNPGLAEQLWTLVEESYPEKIFIYATHSVGFAIRDTVDKVYVISIDGKSLSEFEGMDCFSRAELYGFFGSVPNLLSPGRVLITEGNDKSFDAIFYPWVLGGPGVSIVPGGGCEDLCALVARSGIWGRVSPSLTLLGVVDSDYKSSTRLELLRKNGVLSIPFHEAESFLCVPEILSRLAAHIATQEEIPTPESISSWIVDYLDQNKILIAARRVCSDRAFSYGISVPNKIVRKCASFEELWSNLAEVRRERVDVLLEAASEGALRMEFEAEVSRINSVISEKDALQALMLVPGKQLLGVLAKKAGFRSPIDVMRCLSANFSPEDFSVVESLKEQIMSAFDALSNTD
ncbi:ATP-binding protein [Alcanivorax sp. JB21]|uniref:AAA family ATPase n=1 Tax=Alcanivorax limicola TaxID=2874102 RepID=UPI001CBAACDE|nr:AAA family ATPase [Alcanivorax limicola]MBZ2190274.1 ATP-binding protein [Alcanivorax limicola]